MLKDSSEERCRECALRIVEKCQLLVWLDSVDAAKGQAKQPIRGGVLLELCRDRLGKLDGLAWNTGGAYTNSIGVDIPRRR